MSKGSKRRPQKVADSQLEMNWKQIFKACGLKEVKPKVETGSIVFKCWRELTAQDKRYLKDKLEPDLREGVDFPVYGVPAKHERKKKAAK